MNRFTGLLALCSLAAVCPLPAHAQFSATPAIVRLGAGAAPAAAHDTVLAVVQVRNEGGAAMQFQFYLSDYDHDEAGDYRFGEYGRGRGSCGSRLTATPQAAVLRPGATQDVLLRLAPGMEPCWALLFAESSSRADGQVRVAQRIGVRLVEVGRTEPDGEIEDVTVTITSDSLQVAVSFANLGHAPAELKGALEVRSLATGAVVRRTEIGPLGVLPGTRRRIPVALANGLPAGRYVVVPIIDFGADYLAGAQAEFTLR